MGHPAEEIPPQAVRHPGIPNIMKELLTAWEVSIFERFVADKNGVGKLLRKSELDKREGEAV